MKTSYLLIVLICVFIAGAGLVSPLLLSGTQNQASNQNYQARIDQAAGSTQMPELLREGCSTENERLILTINLPLSTFTFDFDNSNSLGGTKRQSFLATLHCGTPKPFTDYTSRHLGVVPYYQNGEWIYDGIGVAQDLRYKPDHEGDYYFCVMRLQRDTDSGRACHTDAALRFGLDNSTGKEFMINYGIDYQNRRRVPEINDKLREYFHKVIGRINSSAGRD